MVASPVHDAGDHRMDVLGERGAGFASTHLNPSTRQTNRESSLGRASFRASNRLNPQALLLLRRGSIGHKQSDRECVQARVRRISARPTPRARNVLVNVGTNGRNASQEVVLRLFNFGFDLAS